jgi:methylated-DNA-[protein]-cysteine S-methyltransferase
LKTALYEFDGLALLVEADRGFITRIEFVSEDFRTEEHSVNVADAWEDVRMDNRTANDADTALLDEAFHQLNQYFKGELRQFTLPLNPTGTEFFRKVWDELLNIPYGKTETYGEAADKINRPKAARAVGLACNRNPIPILIPCHRIIGKDKSLTGYAGGLDIKKKLLKIEGAL